MATGFEVDQIVMTENEIAQGNFVLPVVDGVLCDVIVMYPGVPRIGTPEFDEWLKDWNEVHNGCKAGGRIEK